MCAKLDFDFEVSAQGFMQDYKTNGTRTDIILLMPDNGTILSSIDEYEVVEIMAATNDGYIDVDYDIIPNEFILKDIYPNPFNPVTNISFTLPYTMQVEINILDIQGRKIRNISSSSYVKGLNSVTVDANDLSSGIYFVELLAEDTKEYTKIMLLK